MRPFLKSALRIFIGVAIVCTVTIALGIFFLPKALHYFQEKDWRKIHESELRANEEISRLNEQITQAAFDQGDLGICEQTKNYTELPCAPWEIDCGMGVPSSSVSDCKSNVFEKIQTSKNCVKHLKSTDQIMDCVTHLESGRYYSEIETCREQCLKKMGLSNAESPESRTCSQDCSRQVDTRWREEIVR